MIDEKLFTESFMKMRADGCEGEAECQCDRCRDADIICNIDWTKQLIAVHHLMPAMPDDLKKRYHSSSSILFTFGVMLGIEYARLEAERNITETKQ